MAGKGERDDGKEGRRLQAQKGGGQGMGQKGTVQTCHCSKVSEEAVDIPHPFSLLISGGSSSRYRARSKQKWPGSQSVSLSCFPIVGWAVVQTRTRGELTMEPQEFMELWSQGLLLKETSPGSNGLAGGGGVQ